LEIKKTSMKKLLIASIALLTLSLNAQITVPKASPAGKIEQRVGLADLSITYNRPAKRERVVFGDVVPFGELWRTGANENAKITTSDALIFGKDTLKAGTYAIFTKPGQTSWEIFFYTDYSNWGTPENWDEKKVALKTNAAISKLTETVENFTIGFDKMENSSAEICLSWENTKVSIPFSLNTKDKVLASIKKTMDGPTANDYHRAASFYFTEKIDMKKALEWSTKAVELRGESAYWMTRLLAQLQAENGDYKKAIETARRSIAAAEKDGDMNYVKQNKDSIEEWSKKKN
jgi:hypothetical protein